MARVFKEYPIEEWECWIYDNQDIFIKDYLGFEIQTLGGVYWDSCTMLIEYSAGLGRESDRFSLETWKEYFSEVNNERES